MCVYVCVRVRAYVCVCAYMCVLEIPKFAMRFLIVLYAVFVLSLATGKIEKRGTGCTLCNSNILYSNL